MKYLGPKNETIKNTISIQNLKKNKVHEHEVDEIAGGEGKKNTIADVSVKCTK